MVIDFAMVISNHAKERIDERFYNLIDVDFLESKIVNVDKNTFDLLFNTCSPSARKAISKGYREIKLFENLGVYGVVNKSTLEVITVFPHENKAVRRIKSSDVYMLKTLTLKVKQSQEMAHNKRANRAIGAEMNRVCRKLAELKVLTGNSANDKRLDHMDRIEGELIAIKRFAIEKLGESVVYGFIDGYREQLNSELCAKTNRNRKSTKTNTRGMAKGMG